MRGRLRCVDSSRPEVGRCWLRGAIVAATETEYIGSQSAPLKVTVGRWHLLRKTLAFQAVRLSAKPAWKEPCTAYRLTISGGVSRQQKAVVSVAPQLANILSIVGVSRHWSVNTGQGQPSVISRQSSAVSRQPSAVSRQSSVISRQCQPSIVSRQSSAVSRRSSVVSRQPSAISGPWSVVSRQSSAVSRQSSPHQSPAPQSTHTPFSSVSPGCRLRARYGHH